MDELTSTEFRKSFQRLTTPTVVTVNGHPLGTWTPSDYIRMNPEPERYTVASVQEAADRLVDNGARALEEEVRHLKAELAKRARDDDALAARVADKVVDRKAAQAQRDAILRKIQTKRRG